MIIIPILQVLIIGFGFMGENHYNNLLELEKQERVKIVGIVDSNQERFRVKKLEHISNCCFSTIEEAYAAGIKPDIVVLATNTATHYDMINDIFKQSAYRDVKLPALFAEKPLVENSQQAQEIITKLDEAGYGKTIPFNCGYLFRESPALDRCISYIKEHHLTIEKIKTVWQKMRDTRRPSAGVHIDEATHPVDVLVNYLFPVLNLPHDKIKLIVSSREYSRSIVNEELQTKLYGINHIPLASVDYDLTIGNVPVECHSSFMRAPQQREIWLDCEHHITLKVSFDEKNADHFMVYQNGAEIVSAHFEKPNKLFLEWLTFLDSIKGGTFCKASPKIPNLFDTYVDIFITETLGQAEIDKEVTVDLSELRLRLGCAYAES